MADGSADLLKRQAQGQEILRVQILEGPARDELIIALKNLDSVAMVDPVPDTPNSFLINSKLEMSSRKNIFNLCVKNNWVLTEMTPIETKLEDIFRELTTKQ